MTVVAVPPQIYHFGPPSTAPRLSSPKRRPFSVADTAPLSPSVVCQSLQDITSALDGHTLTHEAVKRRSASDSVILYSQPNDRPLTAKQGSGDSAAKSAVPGPNVDKLLPFPESTDPITAPPTPHPTHRTPRSSTTTRVHFRPRVRITSGISRHRYSNGNLCSPSNPTPTDSILRDSNPSSHVHSLSHSTPIPIVYHPSHTPDTSVSSSPASSYSVPLRHDDLDKPGWGPLGQRVTLLTTKKRGARSRPLRNQQHTNPDTTERTPLLQSSRFRRPSLPDYDQDLTHDNDGCYVEGEQEEEVQRRADEIDRVFGTFPGRLLNRHWWWWQIEPIARCRCLDESDSED